MEFKRKGTNFNSMKTHLFIAYFLTFLFFIVIVFFVVIKLTEESLLREISSSRKDVLKQVSERANVVKNASITASNLISFDDNIILELNKDEVIDSENLNRYLDEKQEIYNHVFADVGIKYNVIIMAENGYNYNYEEETYDYQKLKDQLWFKHIYDKNGDITFISSFNDSFGERQNNYVFSASKQLLDDNGEFIATIMINVSESYLRSLYEPLILEDNIIYIVDRRGNIISHEDSSFLGLNYFRHDFFDGIQESEDYLIIDKSSGSYLLSIITDEATGWSIIEEIPTLRVFNTVYETINIIIVIMIVCVFIALFISYFASRRISKPLDGLTHTIEKIRNGNLKERSEIKSYNEINDLSEAFNDMIIQINELLSTIVNQEAYRRELELNFLRAQINPHFLYNTLFSIRCMAEMDKKEYLLEMIDAFMSLLNSAFSHDTSLVTIAKELESTEKYLFLQQIRYGNRFEFEIDCDEDINDFVIPALILQPIVENSIFHGIEPKHDYGGITIHAYSINKHYLAIDIIDNGIGVEQKVINEIKNSFANFNVRPSDSIGLANVVNRLNLSFNEDVGFDIISEKHIGTIVRLIIPKKIGESDESSNS